MTAVISSRTLLSLQSQQQQAREENEQTNEFERMNEFAHLAFVSVLVEFFPTCLHLCILAKRLSAARPNIVKRSDETKQDERKENE